MVLNPFRLDDRTIAIIGAASGIGAAAAAACAEQGARVVCLDLDGAGAAATARGIAREGGLASSLAIDLADAGSVESALRALDAEHGGLDGLVSTPGVNVRKPVAALADDELDRVVDLNLKGTFRALRAAARTMGDRKSVV